MKTATIATLLLTATSATAFSTSRTAAATLRQSTTLNLFGSKPKDSNSDAAKQPGMMDQLAMFKKAQELAQKKKKLEIYIKMKMIINPSPKMKTFLSKMKI